LLLFCLLQRAHDVYVDQYRAYLRVFLLRQAGFLVWFFCPPPVFTPLFFFLSIGFSAPESELSPVSGAEGRCVFFTSSSPLFLQKKIFVVSGRTALPPFSSPQQSPPCPLNFFFTGFPSQLVFAKRILVALKPSPTSLCSRGRSGVRAGSEHPMPLSTPLVSDRDGAHPPPQIRHSPLG